MYVFSVRLITILPVRVKGDFRTLADAANYTLLAADGGVRSLKIKTTFSELALDAETLTPTKLTAYNAMAC